MARQFKVEVSYPAGFVSEIYWHDDNKLEFANAPPMMYSNSLINRTDVLEALVAFCKAQKVNKVECTRIVPIAKDAE
jgi:hypothetical protein